MNLLLKRTTRTDKSTIGSLYLQQPDGSELFLCFILEDKDRGLKKDMPLDEIKAAKVHGKTAIPAGTYQVANTYSPRFKKYLPLLLNVPGYEGIRIHPGNTAEHTEGCLLPGKTKGADFVGSSQDAFKDLLKRLTAAEKTSKILITIK